MVGIARHYASVRIERFFDAGNLTILKVRSVDDLLFVGRKTCEFTSARQHRVNDAIAGRFSPHRLWATSWSFELICRAGDQMEPSCHFQTRLL